MNYRDKLKENKLKELTEQWQAIVETIDPSIERDYLFNIGILEGLKMAQTLLMVVNDEL